MHGQDEEQKILISVLAKNAKNMFYSNFIFHRNSEVECMLVKNQVRLETS